MRQKIYRGMVFGLCLMMLIATVPSTHVYAQDGSTSVTHVVQPNENLYRISLRYGVTVQSIATANGIANPNLIYVGQSLTIPGGVDSGASGSQTGDTGGTTTTATYTVVAGDTLSKIASTFNTTVQAIAQANGIANVNLILVGQQLTIPGVAAPTDGDTSSDTTPPDSTADTSGFELGGQVLHFGNLDTMRSADMTWMKVQIRYNRGDNADVTAEAINSAHLNGFKILLSIVGEKDEMASADFNTYTDEFAEFLGGVATLGPEAIEVWNEQNLDREWPAGQISAASYTTLLRKAYQAIKAQNSDVLVISGAPSPTGFFGGCTGNGCDDAPFLTGMVQAGAANYMDCIGVHYNEGILSPNQSSGDPRGSGSHYTRYFSGMLNTYYNAFNGAKPVCWTELGYASPEGYPGGAPAGFEWANSTSVAEQAQWLGEAATLSRTSGKVRLMITWNVNYTDAAPDPSGMYAILRPDSTCPACATLAAAIP